MTINFETIPLAELEKKKLQPDQSPTSPVVLVVDDDRAVADSIALTLNQWGYAAEAAYDSNAALEMAQVVPPELLLTKIALPGIGGIELAVAVQKTVPDCKVLLLSDQTPSGALFSDAQNAQPNGFKVLAKPIHKDVLLAEASRLFGQS